MLFSLLEANNKRHKIVLIFICLIFPNKDEAGMRLQSKTRIGEGRGSNCDDLMERCRSWARHDFGPMASVMQDLTAWKVRAITSRVGMLARSNIAEMQ